MNVKDPYFIIPVVLQSPPDNSFRHNEIIIEKNVFILSLVFEWYGISFQVTSRELVTFY